MPILTSPFLTPDPEIAEVVVNDPIIDVISDKYDKKDVAQVMAFIPFLKKIGEMVGFNA